MKKMLAVSKLAILLLAAVVFAGSVSSVSAQQKRYSKSTSGAELTLGHYYNEREKDGKKWRENCKVIAQLSNKTSDSVITQWRISIGFKGEGDRIESMHRVEGSESNQKSHVYDDMPLTWDFTACYINESDINLSVDKRKKLDPKTGKIID